MSTVHVYHLTDPRDRVVRYVGMTGAPKSRYRGHLREARERQNTPKKKWIAELVAAGLAPVLVIVSSHDNHVAARIAESTEVHRHLATIYNQHDPAKGAKDLRRHG